jgi:site-specific recombinase XerD
MLSPETTTETAVGTNGLVNTLAISGQTQVPASFSALIPGFARHVQFELSLSAKTATKYKECMNSVVKDLGDLPVKVLDLGYVTMLKEKIRNRGAGDSRLYSIIFALKGFLRYCRSALELPVLDPNKIKSPKRPRREVVYLTNEEIKQFIDSIKFENFNPQHNKHTPNIRMDGLRFRTLVEVLLGTGMRISEALSLNRDSIDFEKQEAKIIGKGNKERTVFFNQRAIDWVQFYLQHRTDSAPALFVSQRLSRANVVDMSGLFRRYSKKAGITKHLTPHILRHTMATNLLFNGCPIGHIKEILGHDRLETTCRYYLGLDKSKAKEAHGKYLNF